MSFENIKNLSNRIELEDKQEKAELLYNKIGQISLVYAHSKFLELKNNNNDYSLSAAIESFTPIKDIILKPIFSLDEFNIEKYKKKIDSFIKDFYAELESIYKTNGLDLEKISDLMILKKNNVKKFLEVDNLKEYDSSKKDIDTKILHVTKINNIESDNEKKYQNLKNIGFHQLDHFIEIHVKSFFESDEKSLGGELIKNDFSLVAEHIIDKEPETAAVLARSWLISTPLASRLGFKKIEDDKKDANDSVENDFSTWLQFIDKNGQIDNKRFSELVKTGQIPYKSVKAYIPTEDFLKKYLPKNRRGKIFLKEINADKELKWIKLQEEAGSVKLAWDELIKNKGDFNSFIKKNSVLSEIFNYFSLGERNVYVQFLKKMYCSNTPWSKFYEFKSKDIEKLDNKINQTMEDDLYIKKEVFIE